MQQTLQKAYGSFIVAQRQGSPEACFFAKGRGYSGWTYDKISKPGRTSAPEDF